MSKARELANLGNAYSDGALSNRNLIINGAMQVAQRGTSVSGLTGSAYHTVDRWQTSLVTAGTWTQTQSSDAPAGHNVSLKMECTTADASLAAADECKLTYYVEAQDIKHIGYGSSSASAMTLSFWVKANKTGTYAIWLYQDDAARQLGATYTINASGAWEYKTVTIVGDTSGTINNDNGSGFRVNFVLATGTDYTSGTAATSWEALTNANRYVGHNVNLADTIGNYWQITGVQLEVGDTATPFEHRSYGQELALCQRYYRQSDNHAMFFGCSVGSNSYIYSPILTNVNKHMRAIPTVSSTDLSGGNWASQTSHGVGYANDMVYGYVKTAVQLNDCYGYAVVKMDSEL